MAEELHDETGAFKKGNPGGPGRKPGSRNKWNRIAKDAIIEVFEELGGIDAMADWARENQTEFYRHFAKLIPITHGGDPQNPLTVAWPLPKTTLDQ